MKTVEFNPFAISDVKVEFDCPNCHTFVESNEINLAFIGYATELYIEGDSYKSLSVICGGCERQFDIEVGIGFSDGWITIDDLPEEHSVKVIEIDYGELEAILSNTKFYDTFEAEIFKIRELNETFENNLMELDSSNGMLLNNDLVETMRRLLYTNVITCLESYLSSAFINTVISNQIFLKKFFETFKEFKSQKISYSHMFEMKDRIEDIAKQAMLEVIYHNLNKIKPMYNDTLGVNFPDFGDINKAIVVRHDIVHRNGITKDNTLIVISHLEINSLVDIVDNFVSDIDRQIKKL